MAEEQTQVTPEAAPSMTPESLGVDKASFDKYHSEGTFNWEGYAREQAYKASQAKAPPPAPAQPAEQPKGPPQHSDAQSAVANAGLDWDDLGAKIGNNGDIDESDYEALARIGVPKEVVSNYVEMTRTQSQDMIDNIIDMSGGQDSFNRVYDALQSKPLELRNRIDSLLVDPSTRQYGVDMMFREANIEMPTNAPPAAPAPAPPGGAQNRVGSDTAVQPFQSFEEQVAAQRDPKYKTDAAYRDEVHRRAAAGNYAMGVNHTGGI
jgi:hypothetical protein